MGTTSLGIPYPENTDLVKDGAADMQALAEAANDLYGLVHINTTDFSAVSTQSIDNVFTSAYKNYRVLLNIDSLSGTNVQLTLRLRASGTDTTTNYRSSRIFLSAATTITGGQDPLGTDEFLISGGNFTGAITTSSIDFFNPEEAKLTGFQCLSQNYASTYLQTQINMGQHNASTQFDGFTLMISVGTITGSVSIYGYRK